MKILALFNQENTRTHFQEDGTTRTVCGIPLHTRKYSIPAEIAHPSVNVDCFKCQKSYEASLKKEEE